jgi:lactate dehydrogenase-like 2-hydroxyacid dehydrogenase
MKPYVYVTRHLPEAAWQKLLECCQPEIWDSDVPPTYNEILSHLPEKAGLLTTLSDRIDAALIEAGPLLRVISQCAVGYDNIDVAAATVHGITVGNTPGVLTETTADFTVAMLMAGARRIVEGADLERAAQWQAWGLTMLLGQDIYGATLGLVGLGRIGAAVARRARGFNLCVLYYDVARQLELESELELTYTPLEDLLRQSDFVSLHVSLTPVTRGMISARELGWMKPSAVLINTARGAVVDTDALYTALRDGKLGHAALDVTDPEPLPPGHKLLSLPNVTITPHIASASVATRTRMALMAVENLAAGLKGEKLPYQVNNFVVK